jgi:hypothetical protein
MFISQLRDGVSDLMLSGAYFFPGFFTAIWIKPS